jgi:ribonucleotide reductase alpha subunit
MRVKIARVKDGRAHFAVRVAANGHVCEWTAHEEKAVAQSEEVAEKVVAFYQKHTVNTGDIHFYDVKADRPWRETLKGTKPPVPTPRPDDVKPSGAVADAIAEREEFRRQAIHLGDELERERELAEEAHAREEKLLKEVDEQAKKIAELEAIIASAK